MQQFYIHETFAKRMANRSFVGGTIFGVVVGAAMVYLSAAKAVLEEKKRKAEEESNVVNT